MGYRGSAKIKDHAFGFFPQNAYKAAPCSLTDDDESEEKDSESGALEHLRGV